MGYVWDRPAIAASPISAIVIAGANNSRLAETVAALAGDLAGLRREHEILLVDSGVRESAAGLLAIDGEKTGHCRMLAYEGPTSYGRALAAGIAASRFPLLFTLAADGGYQSTFLNHLLTLIDQVDLVAGYRRGRPWLGRLKNRVLAYLAFGLSLRDPGCSVRLYRKSIFERLPIQSETRFAEVEIVAKANFLGHLIMEAELPWPAAEEPSPGPSLAADARRVFFRPQFLPPAAASPPGGSPPA
jgi:hypothetical protein